MGGKGERGNERNSGVATPRGSVVHVAVSPTALVALRVPAAWASALAVAAAQRALANAASLPAEETVPSLISRAVALTVAAIVLWCQRKSICAGNSGGRLIHSIGYAPNSARNKWGAGAKSSELLTAAAGSFTAIATLGTAEATVLWSADPTASDLAAAAPGSCTAVATLVSAATVAITSAAAWLLIRRALWAEGSRSGGAVLRYDNVLKVESPALGKKKGAFRVKCTAYVEASTLFPSGIGRFIVLSVCAT